MEMTSKWIVFSIVTALTMTSLSGCSSNSDTADSGANAPASDGKRPKLSVFIASRTSDALYTNETLVWKELGKRLNIDFEFITGDIKTMRTKLPVMIASGQYPDIVSGGIADINKYGQSGAFIPLNDPIAKSAPNIKKHLMDDPEAKIQTVSFDGNIYAIPMLSAVRTSEGPLVRKDWLDRLGLPMPETMDDWYNMLKAFKEKDANGNGNPNDEIPFSSVGGQDDKYYLNFADAWGIDLNTDNRWKVENDKLIFTPIDPRAKEYLATMNKWYNEGLIDKEFLSRQEQDFKAAIFSNKVGATNHWIGFLAEFNDLPEAKKVPGFHFEVAKPPVLHKGDKAATRRQQLITVPWAWGISANNKNVEATMKLFDYVYSDEGQILLNFGVEGDSYAKGADGALVYTDKIMKNPDGPRKALWRIGTQALIGFRQDVRYEKALCSSPDVCRQLFSYMDNKLFADPAPTFKYTDADFEEYNKITTQINTYVDSMLSKFIIGQEPLSKFDEYVAKVKSMNYDKLESIQKRAYDKYKELKK
ncbi:hypothetical protein AV654_05885 [Paenibacillus elgii]|uniref:ABC transporter substrate-binding protein n=2 Tax=Paenibacillus elgii TaxID=189691 RepID=A0A161S0C7_9BACL|nr:hypothetical protein AV654_05885 [Paenibacillus elgii]